MALFAKDWDGRKPARNPQICGALGPGIDREIVTRIAERIAAPMAIAHEAPQAIVLTDRKPFAWRNRRSHGLALPELAPPSRVKPRSWQEAATDADAAGVAISPARTLVHSSVSGTAGIYYATRGNAVYFAGRLDALVLGIGERRQADWQAWSGILTFASPYGDRTPFRQVKRLRQLSSLRWRDGKARVRSEPWPWSAVEPDRSIEEGTPAVVEALADAVEPLGSGPLISLLSGGADSRVMLLAALRRRDPDGIVALTHDTGRDTERAAATAVAESLGLEHELIALASPQEYWASWLSRTTHSDFQFLADVFIAPLLPRVGEIAEPVLDGLALDTFGVRGGRGYRMEMFADESEWTSRTIWEHTHKRALGRAPLIAFGKRKGKALRAMSKQQMIEESLPFRGMRNHPVLVWYVTRTMRGVSLAPRQVFGAVAPVVTPAASHRAAQEILAVAPEQKWGGAFYAEMLRLLGGEASRLPTTAQLSTREGTDATGNRSHRYGDSPETAERLEEALGNPAIAPLIGDEMAQVLERRELGGKLANANWRRAALSLAHLSAWQRHHAEILGPLSLKRVRHSA